MADVKSDPNCAQPACKSKVDMFKSFMGGKASAGGKSSNAKATPSVEAKSAEPSMPDDCPLGREELGRSTWGLLHSMGAYFPEKPSPEYQAKARTFVEALALMYPCTHCAEDFQNEVKKSPPRLESRTTFSMWLCEQHNLVNKKIGNPIFDCSIEKLDERWKTGRPACWGEDGDAESIPSTLGQDQE